MLRIVLAAAAVLLSVTAGAQATERFLTLELKSGTVKIEMLPDIAPQHVDRIATLAQQGAYNGIAFHRVIEGFMAQTGDVEHGKVADDGSVSSRAGTGGSSMSDIPAEFSDVPFDRGVVGMARSQRVDSANSQFFIMFDDGHFLNGQYTVWGRVVEGMEHVDNIALGSGQSGRVEKPDRILSARVE